jgi:putative mycofactocin binding protein MftB
MTEQSDHLIDPMLTQAWELSAAVALRPEPFGALAYHFGNRKLTFLKRPELVQLVRALADHEDVAEALSAAGISPSNYDGYVAALRGLASTDMIRPRESGAKRPVDEEESR